MKRITIGCLAAAGLMLVFAGAARAETRRQVPEPEKAVPAEATDTPVYGLAPSPEAMLPADGEPAAVGLAGPADPWHAAPGLPDLEQPTACCERCGFGVCCPEHWYFENGVRVLARNSVRYAPLLRDVGLGGAVVYNTRDLDYGISAGYSGTLGRYLGRTSFNYDEYGELTFWGLNQWSKSDEVDAAGRITNVGFTSTFGSLYTPFDPRIGGFNRVDNVTFDLRHRINNVELNYWLRPRPVADMMVLLPNGRWVRQCQPDWYWAHMIGLRAMFIDDRLHMRTRGTIQNNDYSVDPPTTTEAPVSGDYLVNAHNSLLGFQIGGDLSYRTCRWTLGTRYSVAPFLNFANQQSQITSDGTGDPLSTWDNFDLRRTRDDNVAAVALNLGFTGSYRILPHMVLRAAYDLMWVPGVALAPDQLDFTLNPDSSQNSTLAKLNTGGTLFYQGLTMSAELTW